MIAKILSSETSAPVVLSSANRLNGGSYVAWILKSTLIDAGGKKHTAPVIFAMMESHQVSAINRLLELGADITATPYIRFLTYKGQARQKSIGVAAIRITWASSASPKDIKLETRWLCVMPENFDGDSTIRGELYETLLEEEYLQMSFCMSDGKLAMIEAEDQQIEFGLDITLLPEHFDAIEAMQSVSMRQPLPSTTEDHAQVFAITQAIFDDVDLEREFFPPLPHFPQH